MAEDMTSMDFDGNSDSVTSEGTLIGSPTPSIHGSDETSSTNLSLGETYHETSVIRTTSSGYHSGVVGSSSSGYHSGVVGSSSSGYQSGVVGPTAYSVTQPPKPASVGQNQDGSRGDTASQDSGILSMTSERSQSFPLQYTNDGKRTPEWINNRESTMAEDMTSMDFDGNSDSGIGTGSDSQSVTSEGTLIGSPALSVQRNGHHGSTSSGYNSGHNGTFPHQTQVGGQLGRTEVLPTLAENQDSLTLTQEWFDKHFDVFVKTMEGKTITIQTSGDETVTSFRAKVDERTGVPGTQQRLTSQLGRTLEDGKILRDYEIGRHCTIYCQGRLRGGSSINRF